LFVLVRNLVDDVSNFVSHGGEILSVVGFDGGFAVLVNWLGMEEGVLSKGPSVEFLGYVMDVRSGVLLGICD